MLVDRETSGGLRQIYTEIPPDQRTCPFAPAETAATV